MQKIAQSGHTVSILALFMGCRVVEWLVMWQWQFFYLHLKIDFYLQFCSHEKLRREEANPRQQSMTCSPSATAPRNLAATHWSRRSSDSHWQSGGSGAKCGESKVLQSSSSPRSGRGSLTRTRGTSTPEASSSAPWSTDSKAQKPLSHFESQRRRFASRPTSRERLLGSLMTSSKLTKSFPRHQVDFLQQESLRETKLRPEQYQKQFHLFKFRAMWSWNGPRPEGLKLNLKYISHVLRSWVRSNLWKLQIIFS